MRKIGWTGMAGKFLGGGGLRKLPHPESAPHCYPPLHQRLAGWLRGLSRVVGRFCFTRQLRCNVFGRSIVLPCGGRHASKFMDVRYTDLARRSHNPGLQRSLTCWHDHSAGTKWPVIELDYLWPAVRFPHAPGPKEQRGMINYLDPSPGTLSCLGRECTSLRWSFCACACDL